MSPGRAAKGCDYRATFMIEGREIPGVLEKWLFDALPVDFTVKFSRRPTRSQQEGAPPRGLRVIEVTATASTPELLMEKVAALSRSLERAGVSLISVSGTRMHKK